MRSAFITERTIWPSLTTPRRRLVPFGRRLPIDNYLWRLYYHLFGEPSYRSQLFWVYLIRLVSVDSAARWLDVGCGGGDFLVELAKTCPNASFTGIDPNPVAIAQAQELSRMANTRNVTWVQTVLDDLDIHDFDVVSALGVMEFTADPPATVQQLAEHARDGGRIVFTAPNRRRTGRNGSLSSIHRFDSTELGLWMKRASIPTPEILEAVKGLSFRAYSVSQNLQRLPFAAAAFHVISAPLVFVDAKFPGSGELLFCAGSVRRRVSLDL